MRVRLTYAQMSIATHVAMMRHGSDIKRGAKHRHGLSREKWTWDKEVDGCAAELLVAQHFNLYWDGALNNFDALDVGGLIEVRQTPWSTGRLPLHPDDGDNDPFVLVTGHDSEFNIVGWQFAREGKQQQWWCDPTGENRPAFFVPQDELHDLQGLTAWVRAQQALAA